MAPSLLLAIALLPLLPVTSVAVSAAEAETCFYRQHQSATIDVRQASKRAAGATDALALQSQQACVRACCSTAVKPGGPAVHVLGLSPTHPGPVQLCWSFYRCQVQHGGVQR